MESSSHPVAPGRKTNTLTVPSLKENVIFIGSEELYDLFWLKMMFVAPGFAMADRQLQIRPADKTTLAYVDVGYTRAEKLTLELLKDQRSFDLLPLQTLADVTGHVNDRTRYLIQDMVFFCHGLPGRLALNYNRWDGIDIDSESLSSMSAYAFVRGGRIYSYACRTGNSSSDESFDNDEEAHPEESLAQKMADHFSVEVFAFLRRTFFGDVLREESDSDRIASTLKQARETRDGQIIDIPPDHEGLPHPGLGEGGWFSSTDEEGTDEYALWRKQGAIRLPSADSTPEGLSTAMRRFTPS